MSKKHHGLALGGGAVLGAAHVGVLKALHESNIRIDCIAGTSIGAFVAAFYAFGKTPDEIHEIALKLRWMDISGMSFSGMGLLANKKLGDLVIEHLGEKNIEEAAIPLAMIATDITSGEKVVLNKGSVAKAVMASTAIPGVFCPIELDGRLLVDGGIVENVPIETVRNLGAEHVTGVDLNAGNSYNKPSHILSVMINSFHFMLKTATQFQTDQADTVIAPDLGKFDMIDTKQVKELINVGYEEAIKAVKQLPT
jgi:NTE family protein